MLRRTNVAVLIALAVGAVGGWAGASGKFDSLLKAEAKASTEAPVAGRAAVRIDGELLLGPGQERGDFDAQLRIPTLRPTTRR